MSRQQQYKEDMAMLERQKKQTAARLRMADEAKVAKEKAQKSIDLKQMMAQSAPTFEVGKNPGWIEQSKGLKFSSKINLIGRLAKQVEKERIRDDAAYAADLKRLNAKHSSGGRRKHTKRKHTKRKHTKRKHTKRKHTKRHIFL